MIITKNKNLLIIAVIAVTISTITGILVSTYMQQDASAQNQNNTGNIRNLTGSIQVFPTPSQVIQPKANVSLSDASTSAEKAVGANSHVISAHLGIVNGFLVYVAHVVDTNNNIHRVIIDAGNGELTPCINQSVII